MPAWEVEKGLLEPRSDTKPDKNNWNRGQELARFPKDNQLFGSRQRQKARSSGIGVEKEVVRVLPVLLGVFYCVQLLVRHSVLR